MTDHESDAQAARQMVDIVQARLPLATGLRALGEEAPNRRLRRFLCGASQRLEAGDSIESVFGASAKGVPAPLQGLIRAGVESGRIGVALEEYLEVVRSTVDHRYRAMTSLVYPLILCLVGLGVFTFAAIAVIPEFERIFADFGTELPAVTAAMLIAGDVWVRFGMWLAAAVLLLAGSLFLIARLMGGTALARRILCEIPLWGKVLRYTALSGFCRLLALLIDSGVPLAEAVRLAGGAVRDADLEAACRLLSDDVERGLPLQKAAITIRQFPLSLIQVFRWEDRREAFVDALRAASEVFAARSQISGHALISILEPMSILAVAGSVGFFVVAMFMPMVKLLNDLS